MLDSTPPTPFSTPQRTDSLDMTLSRTALTPAVGEIFGELNTAESRAAQVVAMIPQMSDEEVKTAFFYAKEIGKAAWRIEAAADAEIVKRAQARAYQRGDEGGARATIAKVAAELGTSPTDLYRDAQIHNTFFAEEKILSAENLLQDEMCPAGGTHLQEKSFYQEALSAPDPIAAIELMAERKAENPFYGRREARRDVQLLRTASVMTPAFPTTKYRCLVIDPPWPVEKIERVERPNQEAFLDYPIMSLEQIGELPIADMADAHGCHVYLWVTQKFLPDGMRLFDLWGVAYQCTLTWVKPSGMTPYSWMYNTEHLDAGATWKFRVTSFKKYITRYKIVQVKSH